MLLIVDRTGFFTLDLVPGRVGVFQDRLSGFESFEAPDPAEWTARGYAIVNVNSRGAFDSQGDIRLVASHTLQLALTAQMLWFWRGP